MNQSWKQHLDQAIERHFDQMVAVRRHLHAHPELSGDEHQTSLYLYQALNDGGLDVRIGPEGRGVIADLAGRESRDPSPRIALRADIDALRIQDQKEVNYRSTREGVMHACGHDAHAAIVTGALLALHDLWQADQLPAPGGVRGIFQPAEETCEGAKDMIQSGCLQGVDAILGLHVDPSRQVGRIGLKDGILTAYSDSMWLKIRGRAGHAARPHEASDPIAAGAQLISSLYMFVPRVTDSQEAVVLSIGQIQGAETVNVIPEEILLGGTLRTLDATVREDTIEHIRRLADGIARMSGTSIEVTFGLGSASIQNDPVLMGLLREAGREVVGPRCIDTIPRPSMGSEDFAFYLEHVPGAMFRLGSASTPAGSASLHTPTFDIDEEALRVGSRLFARSAIGWMLEKNA